MLGTKKHDTPATDRLADLEVEIARLSDERLVTRAAVAACRATARHSMSPAMGPPAVRAVREAEAVAAHAEAQAVDAEVAVRELQARRERDALRAELAAAEQAARAALTERELRTELKRTEAELEARRTERQRTWHGVNAAMAAERHTQTEADRRFTGAVPPTADEARAYGVWQDAISASRAAAAADEAALEQIARTKARRDALVADLDRRERAWSLPQPATVPPLPDARLSEDERIEALTALLLNLSRRRARAADRLREATEKRASVKADGRSLAGVIAARYADYDAEAQQALRDLQALGQRQQEAQHELYRLEGRPVAG